MRVVCVLHFLLVLVVTLSFAAETPRPDQLDFPELELQFPSISQHHLDNGMKVYLKEDDELPLVNITVMIEGGSIHDALDQTGLSPWFAQGLETGGTATLTPQQLEEELDRMAAQLSVSSNHYSYQIDLSVHQRDLRRGLQILQDLLRQPRFDTERMELARQRLLEGIHRKNDNPGAIAGRFLAQAVNPGHPFGAEPTIEGVSRLTRDDLESLHQRFFQPSRVWWGVSGAVNEEQFLAELTLLFADWQSDSAQVFVLPPLPAEPQARVMVVDRKLPQTSVVMGHRGVSKDAPDMMALRVANHILGGGGFNSRLMKEIRSSRGLVYSIYSSVQLGRYLPELFIIAGETRNDTALAMVESVQEMMVDMTSIAVTEDELELAKNSLINSFIFAFENTHSVVTQKVRLDFYGYPADYLETYQQQIAELTQTDILEAAQTYLRPDALQIVLVGDSDVLMPHLAQNDYDNVVLIDLQSVEKTDRL